MKKRLLILASGAGSNAARLIDRFQGSDSVEVCHIISDRAMAGVLDLGENAGIATSIIAAAEVRAGRLKEGIDALHPDLIVLAGYLLLIPAEVVKVYGDRMINLHPSILPAYGGKGMYGQRVLKAVLENGEKETGITIHYVNEAFDEGRIIAQFRCEVRPDDSIASLQERIRTLEHRHLPEVVETLLT